MLSRLHIANDSTFVLELICLFDRLHKVTFNRRQRIASIAVRRKRHQIFIGKILQVKVLDYFAKGTDYKP